MRDELPYDRRNIGSADITGIVEVYPVDARIPFGCFDLRLWAKNKKAGETRPFNRLNDQCQYIRGQGSKAMSEH